LSIAKQVTTQRDWSSGELDISMKRADDMPEMRAGARQLSNWRILNSRAIQNRPGRSAVFLESGRVEKVTMSPGNTFYLVFGAGKMRVYTLAGAKVFDQSGMPWALNTVQKIVWDIYKLNIYIFFPGNVPQILTWNGASTWSIANYAESVVGTGQKRTAFYRISPIGITMQPSATTGSVTLTFSSGMALTSSYIGTRMRFVNHQLLITAVADATHATATVEESLFPGAVMTGGSGVDLTQFFQIGDVVIGGTNNAKGVVTSFGTTSTPNDSMTVQQTNGTQFGDGTVQIVVGPNGSVRIPSATTIVPQACTIWDDEVMNSFRGYPASCFVDQNRLGLCNFPDVPGLVAWSANGLLTDLYTDVNNASPANAILEIVPGKSQVLFVVAGPESSEFVFCDNAIYYIPITAQNPLKPGSVAFNLLSRDGNATNVQPRVVQEVILFLNAGMNSIMSILAPGAYYRPYGVKNLSEKHGHLIKSPVAFAIPTANETSEERYAYVLNSDGSLAVGKYETENGMIKGIIGWLPWSGAGTVSWISSFIADVVFTTTYAPNGITPVSVVEELDNAQYLDAAISVNAVPSGITTPGGKGPLWWLASGTVYLIDQVTRFMGTYQIDANGFLVPQNIDGENLASATLVAGQEWTAIYEPFIPGAQPGQDGQQRLRRRRISKTMITVQNSTGFTYGRRVIAAWNIGMDDPAQPAPLREETYLFRPIGRSYDPRIPLVKDTPGPETIVEATFEVTV
jgi:hypothetical protein